MLTPVYLIFILAMHAQQTPALLDAPLSSSGAVSRVNNANLEATETKPPVLLHSVDPEYSKKARRKKFSGDVKIALVVDENGAPQEVHVEHGVGFGLDEKAVEAVKQYRFKPALRNGKPVAMPLYVVINFRIF